MGYLKGAPSHLLPRSRSRLPSLADPVGRQPGSHSPPCLGLWDETHRQHPGAGVCLLSPQLRPLLSAACPDFAPSSGPLEMPSSRQPSFPGTACGLPPPCFRCQSSEAAEPKSCSLGGRGPDQGPIPPVPCALGQGLCLIMAPTPPSLVPKTKVGSHLAMSPKLRGSLWAYCSSRWDPGVSRG